MEAAPRPSRLALVGRPKWWQWWSFAIDWRHSKPAGNRPAQSSADEPREQLNFLIAPVVLLLLLLSLFLPLP